ncbi:hypothetical protein HanRHA438_Chr03g0141391 [Helianthus annuus]|nr:hypothetical protein HanIR_Chr03g0141251 [Helianthus annuus]KAJ0609434.1 hypothetical protein HanHA89_Chr03g0119981 [Helianthus annuus]KAJ0769495.1 hypothetical protein HanLR1_Chr03g0113381 [Helianthus annuus]KAJ0937366.1 hypothetical protein HanRHA438_Chr03g0141391 [Helianthus annuus]
MPCRDGIKHERLTGQDEARKRIRTRTHKVSDFRNHFLFINEVKMVSRWWSSMLELHGRSERVKM